MAARGTKRGRSGVEGEPTTAGSVIPQLVDGIDLTKRNLTPDEGFVAVRVDGATNVVDLAHLLGQPVEQTQKMLRRLVQLKVVVMEGVDPQDSGFEPESDDVLLYGDFVFPVHLIQETCDLSLEEKKRIIWFHEHLEEWTLYEILQVRRKADAKEIKAGYFERSKEWHPDSFGRQALGAFKQLVKENFRKVQQAYSVLSHERKRAAYDGTIAHLPDEEQIAEMHLNQDRKRREQRRSEESSRRRKRRNPMRKRLGQAKKLYQEALEKKDTGDLMGALRAAQTAEAFDSRDIHRKLVEELKTGAQEMRIGPLVKRGISQEKLTNWALAIECFEEAVRLAPDFGPARLRLAYNMVNAGRNPQRASSEAQKAVSLLPDEPEAHFVLGMCYEKGGMEKAAIRAFSRALELKPNYTDAKKRLKKLKWGF